ncbi:NADAR family protein [Desulfoluna butyratoxydans]|uniref:Nadar n=1 Tax=Desulfoluna butyratoxydans TaxID=231438 RepID=A0A4U8YL65_9BACT|nr:NADAR family protein [Desulfoluna butyratoxydans]VFQ44665.1 nadar [Desulfoluna butyratoxydans]
MHEKIIDIDSLQEEVRAGKRFDYLFFWGHQPRKDGRTGKQCFSQWWQAPFDLDGIRYTSAEVYMMAEKARLFNDEAMRRNIIECAHPREAKKWGRSIKNFHEAEWNRHRFDIVVRGNKAKFEQNEALKTYLLGTGDCILVEASPVDTIWGIGLAEDNPLCRDPEQWNGLNLLGFALMNVRSILRQS